MEFQIGSMHFSIYSSLIYIWFLYENAGDDLSVKYLMSIGCLRQYVNEQTKHLFSDLMRVKSSNFMYFWLII